ASSKLRPTHTQTPAADGRAVTAGGGRAPGAAEAKAARRPGMGPRPPRRQAAERHSEKVASEPIGDDLVEHDSEATANEPGDAPSDIHADADAGNEPETGRLGGGRSEAAGGRQARAPAGGGGAGGGKRAPGRTEARGGHRD